MNSFGANGDWDSNGERLTKLGSTVQNRSFELLQFATVNKTKNNSPIRNTFQQKMEINESIAIRQHLAERKFLSTRILNTLLIISLPFERKKFLWFRPTKTSYEIHLVFSPCLITFLETFPRQGKRKNKWGKKRRIILNSTRLSLLNNEGSARFFFFFRLRLKYSEERILSRPCSWE